MDMDYSVLSYPWTWRKHPGAGGRGPAAGTGGYQLALRTPGIMPESESSRKQIRQSPNRRKNARDLPHRPHRLWTRTPNFGFRLLFSIMAFRAI
jgi:hypothetical protein